VYLVSSTAKGGETKIRDADNEIIKHTAFTCEWENDGVIKSNWPRTGPYVPPMALVREDTEIKFASTVGLKTPATCFSNVVTRILMNFAMHYGWPKVTARA